MVLMLIPVVCCCCYSMPQLKSRAYASGAVKLSEDFAKLVNNPDGSDVRFLVGGYGPATDSNSSLKTHGPTEPVTMYGHSLILRYRSKYFDTMLGSDWVEKSDGVIHKPNISHVTFHAVLHYIYTGNIKVDDLALLDLIVAAEEMELQELSEGCQAKVVEVLNQVIPDEDDEENANDKEPKHIPFNPAIHKFLIPGLTLACQHILSEFFQDLLDFTFANIGTIFDSTDLLAAFLNKIPSQIMKQILASDLLPLTEFDAWELALNWACHQTKVLKSMVESQLKMNTTNEDDVDIDPEAVSSGSNAPEGIVAEGVDDPLISAEQLNILKANLIHLTPAIRFSLMEPEQYARTTEALMFFLPARRYIRLQRFFSQWDKNLPFESPRSLKLNKTKSKIVNDGGSWVLLKKWIFEANGLSWCRSSADLNFNLLHQASTHGFQASTFHQRCDNQGPTLVLVKSTNGHIFGGVNFIPWTSASVYSPSDNNFLFALKDGQHRDDPALFRITQRQNAAYNYSSFGPTFGGGHDIYICDNSNSAAGSYSYLGSTYTGPGASDSALAGERSFLVADYEVFAILKK
jgi:hypothetical protein